MERPKSVDVYKDMMKIVESAFPGASTVSLDLDTLDCSQFMSMSK